MRRDLRFQRTSEMSTDKLLRSCHSAKTFDGFTFVNLLDGTFIETNSLSKVRLQDLLPEIRTVYNTRRQIVGKRKNIGDILFSGHLVSKKL